MRETFTDQIDAIAFGVDVEQDLVDQHSKIVLHKTVNIAKQLRIPEKQIKKWADNRSALISKRRDLIMTLMWRPLKVRSDEL